MINILAAEKLMQQSPKVYATFLLWLLSALFENLPEIGDPDKPKLVFFFDEAHLLFADIEKAVQEKLEQMVRLIRSKGSEFISLVKIHSIFRMLYLANWEIECSTPCARLPRAIKKRFPPRPKRFGKIRN